MTTGPDHYLLAQNALLTALIDGIPAADATKLQLDGIGHAILALAAAVGTIGNADEHRSPEDCMAWDRVAGEHAAKFERDRKARQAKLAAQLDGTVCYVCDEEFVEGEAAVPTSGDDGRQLFAHRWHDTEDGA